MPFRITFTKSLGMQTIELRQFARQYVGFSSLSLRCSSRGRCSLASKINSSCKFVRHKHHVSLRDRGSPSSFSTSSYSCCFRSNYPDGFARAWPSASSCCRWRASADIWFINTCWRARPLRRYRRGSYGLNSNTACSVGSCRCRQDRLRLAGHRPSNLDQVSWVSRKRACSRVDRTDGLTSATKRNTRFATEWLIQ